MNIAATSYSKRQEEAIKEKITIAYLNSMWTIQWLGKRHQQPKPLKDILNKLGQEQKAMTAEQMLEKVKVLNVMFGGEVRSVGKE